MISWFRSASLWAVLAAGAMAAPPAAVAPPATPGASGAALPPSAAAFLASLPKWTSSVSLEAGYGYKDNLLLSYADEEGSAFAHGGVECVLLHVPTGRYDYTLYVEADRKYFFTGRTIDHEAQAWVVTEPGYRFSDTLRVSVPLTGYYTDRVFDVSDTDIERSVARLQETGAMAGPSVRWAFLPAWYVEAQGVAQRRTYVDHAYNSDVGEGSLRLGWVPHERCEFRLSAGRRWRNFDGRSQYSSAGREQVGTRLKISEEEGELRGDLKWDEAARWRTTTRVGGSHYRDNGSGYFSYREEKAAQDVEWQGEAWLVRFTGMARRVDYNVQTVGFGINPPSRLRDEFSTELHLERKLSARWTIFGTYTWERSRSNDRFASYVVNEGLLGMRWSWER